MSKNVTKTINPLHFEDLEVHRFEDLVRQLAYNFKEWRILEATGRSGSDDGFDIRGWEIVDANDEIDDDSDNDSETQSKIEDDRIWLIQCKREKNINPSKVSDYLDEIKNKEKAIYGLIFVAACNISKKTRDIFLHKSRENGYKEFYIWSKSELEDMLFQPQNDNLLFAYFGISLIIKRRSLKSQIRKKIIIKNRIINCFNGGIKFRGRENVLVRDAADNEYPFIKSKKEYKNNPSWLLRSFTGHYYDGIEILLRSHFAYANYETKEWDFVEQINDAIPHEDYWLREKNNKEFIKRGKVLNYWDNKIPKGNKAWFNIYGIIPYNDILEVDKYGDIVAQCPHIFIENGGNGLFRYIKTELLIEDDFSYFDSKRIVNPDRKKRIKFFPKVFPNPKNKPDRQNPPVNKKSIE